MPSRDIFARKRLTLTSCDRIDELRVQTTDGEQVLTDFLSIADVLELMHALGSWIDQVECPDEHVRNAIQLLMSPDRQHLTDDAREAIDAAVARLRRASRVLGVTQR